MPTLYLLRHAKSSWEDTSLRDHERPLAPRGRRAAPAMGRFMSAEGLVPDRVLCSTAVRTRETWSLVAPFLGEDLPVTYDRTLYGASARELLELLRGLPDDVGRVLVIGHNPGVELLALALAGEPEREDGHRMRHKFPTAALAVFACDGEGWTALGPSRCRLDRFVRPKDLPEARERRL